MVWSWSSSSAVCVLLVVAAGCCCAQQQFKLRPYAVPQNPLMGLNGINSMHTDPYLTDTSNFTGPLSPDPLRIKTTTTDECYCIAFTTDKTRVVALCIGILLEHNLHLMDRKTMKVLSTVSLGRQPPESGVEFPKSGIYFYMDNEDHAVVSIWKNITLFSFTGDTISVYKSYSVASLIGEDNLSSAMPGFDGLMWWISIGGKVGTVNLNTSEIHVYDTGEPLDKGFSADETGKVFIVTDYALYCFKSDMTGAPYVYWRQTYDRGSAKKPGMQSQGSGTSPKLFGSKYNYVAIADNADVQDNLLVYERTTGNLICSLPLFLPNQSGIDTSYIGYFDSLIIINNYNHDPFGIRPTAPGVMRADVTSDGRCVAIWEDLHSRPQAGLKMSQVNGIVYLNIGWDSDTDKNFYVAGFDFETGERVYNLPLGEGLVHSTYGVSNQLGPDGELYVGDLLGLIAVYP